MTPAEHYRAAERLVESAGARATRRGRPGLPRQRRSPGAVVSAPLPVLTVQRGSLVDRVLSHTLRRSRDRQVVARSLWTWDDDGTGVYRLTVLGILHTLTGLTVDRVDPPPPRDPRWEGVSGGVTFQPEREVFDHRDGAPDEPFTIPARYALVLEVPTSDGVVVQISYIPPDVWGYSELVREVYSLAVVTVDDRLDEEEARRG